MPVTAKLSRKFYERLGDDVADELVDWFNAVDATYKADLKEINDLNWERLDSRLKYMDEHWESRLQSMDARLDSRIDRLRADLMKWMFIYWTGTVAALIGIGYFGPK